MLTNKESLKAGRMSEITKSAMLWLGVDLVCLHEHMTLCKYAREDVSMQFYEANSDIFAA